MANTNGKEPEIDWEDILLRLTAYTRSFANRKHWFRGESTYTFLQGKEVKDYVYDSILHYLSAKEKYDPSKGTLLDYLKYNLVRSLVNIDSNKKENRITIDINLFTGHSDDEQDDTGSYLDRIGPCTEALFADEIDYPAIKEYIENEIRSDQVAENIFLGIFIYGLPRRQIIEEFSMTAEEYNNGKRRLDTVITRTKIYFTANKKAV